MRVRAIKDYHDLELKKLIVAGTEFEVAEARGKALSTNNNASGIPLVEVIKAPTPTTKRVAKKKED